ncbi:MAG: GNAT family N-acetyltransferase [Rhodoferax sp.]|uniref:GNAT family N-acetyltransferase n=1 Tax=Rhodoferax sp. TaxID=50421 RepID=UPI0026371733|nr:GNAT family N-acetyltransferase [Rhodoferax sp.]MDD5334868.1 GNAT family N-acetyltransferase [Rhodoferax sp.]
MSSERAFVDQACAQALFDALPAEMQWPTLSPAYVAADALRDSQLAPVFLVSQEDDGLLMHGVHEAHVPGLEARDWQSAYGYGGPIVHHMNAEALTRAWRRLDAEATVRHVVAEFVRFHPALENHHFYPGTVFADRAVVVINLDTADLLSSYKGRARTAIRKAERAGLQVSFETQEHAIEIFPAFYRRCMGEIDADNFYLFSDAYFEHMLRLPGARVLSVSDGEKRLSMGLFLFGPKQAEYHLSGTLRAGRQSGATNLLVHAAAQTAQSSGCLSLYLGGGTSMRPDDPLLRFKESFAAAHLMFRFGHRIHDPATYARLREGAPQLAANSKRLLFYRG